MINKLECLLMESFNIDKKVIDYVEKQEKTMVNKFSELDKLKEFNQYRVVDAMHKSLLGATDFNWTTGYGYGDQGRDKTEEIYATIFKTEDALVRPTIASGTHALSLVLNGLLLPGDHLMYATGRPYDTMLQVIGIEGEEPGNLIEMGIEYSQAKFEDNIIDREEIISMIKDNTKLVTIQRSTGYSDRRALSVEEIGEITSIVKSVNKDIIVMVDNCYGEFLDYIEPTEVGADVMAGSLIKNPGGGIAIAGGYIVGRKDLIRRIANKLTAPGLGKDSGTTFGTTRTTLQGLFLAPLIVTEAVKGALLVAKVYDSLGFNIVPKLNDVRSDIIQAIEFKDPEKVKEFCKGIQSAAAVDAHFTPEPWDMPGYEDPVIMASGSFIEGSSIELSADAPMREPYYAYYQGGLTYPHCKLGVMISLNNLYTKGLVNL